MDRYRRITHPQRGDLISLLLLLAYFPYFWKNKSTLMKSPCCLYVIVSPPSTFECLNKSLWNLVCIMGPDPISAAFFINPSHQSVYVFVSSIFARQRLGRTLPRQQIHTQQ
jgi:hypothetical protein